MDRIGAMQRLIPRCAAIAAALLMTVIPLTQAQAQTDSDHALVFFRPARGVLGTDTPTEEWTFEGRAEQVISLIATRASGDLDPVIQVVGPDGQVIAENDDLDSLVVDAGLEALALPADGTYIARVMHYGETSGEYDLTLTPGFARLAYQQSFDDPALVWVAPDSGGVVDQGRLRLRVVGETASALAIAPDVPPLTDYYYEASARLFASPSYAEFGLVLCAQGTPERVQRSYQFRVNSEGRWTVLFQDASGVFVLRTWTPNAALDVSEWKLGVLARGSDFSFYANGTLLGTVSDSRLSEPGMIGVLVGTGAAQPDPAVVVFDDVLVTERLGTTYKGLPLVLTSWDSFSPEEIVAELAASGQVIPALARDLFVTEQSLMAVNIAARFDLLGTAQADYDNLLYGATVNITTGGQAVGCGLVVRWQDERDLTLAYIDTAGGFGVVQAQDAALTTNMYDLTRMVAEGSNRLLIVANDDHMAVYINGALVTQETVSPGAGRVGIALLNYEDVSTDCYFKDVWVWPLVPGD
jgi:hypothetical protein